MEMTPDITHPATYIQTALRRTVFESDEADGLFEGFKEYMVDYVEVQGPSVETNRVWCFHLVERMMTSAVQGGEIRLLKKDGPAT